jgi:hypothetical protein
MYVVSIFAPAPRDPVYSTVTVGLGSLTNWDLLFEKRVDTLAVDPDVGGRFGR